MHDALIPHRKAVQSSRRGQIYRQDRSVTPGAPPFGIPRMFSLSAFSLLDRARPVFSFWRNQKEKMGGAMNQPASWLAFPRPSGQVQTFPLQGKSKIPWKKKKLPLSGERITGGFGYSIPNNQSLFHGIKTSKTPAGNQLHTLDRQIL